MDLYRYITESRKKLFRSAKAFWKASDAPFSYEYYSNIERGTKFPNIQTLLFLCDKLQLNRKKACFLWAMESMPDEETKNYFKWDDDVIENNVPIGPQIQLEKTFLVTDKHKRLLESSPLYWEILSFFAMHEHHSFSLQELLASIDMPKDELLNVLGKLVEHDLLTYKNRKYAHPNIYMHIPNTGEFHKLRNQNYLHAAKQVLHSLPADAIEHDLAYRTTINKKLTAKQVSRVTRHIRFVVGDLLNQDTPGGKDDGLSYTFCVLFGERDFKNRVKR